jgi:hypothetical protein
MNKIIHRFTVCCLIALMSFKLFGGFSYNLYFWWNQKQLAKEHCINQNKPKLKCNGKCYLAKQLAKVENDYQKKQRQPAPFQLKATEYYSVSEKAIQIQLVPLETTETKPFDDYEVVFSNIAQSIPTPPPDLV